MPNPTLIISWDQFSLKIEAPGLNGQRRKIEDVAFDDLPEPIQAELIRQRDHLAAQPQPTLAPSIRDRPDPEVERQRRNEEAAQERLARFNEWLDTLPQAERERQIQLRDQRLEKARNCQNELAKSIWYTTASRHGTKLANRVIADPKRRPRVARSLDKSKTKLPEGVLPLNIKITL